ncbi:putative secreted protein [Erysiphe neolycopersici]|uniref:Putative secreted protein n=1 Tax=Erysiphe neolycopersici TaxID=212602 RepID=A0A420I3E8_9PEZI|nr:putative secreted protein [Erysiphe neolycopersici]
MATLAQSAPLDGAGLDNYGSYGAYGAYSSYGQYDASLNNVPKALSAQENPQASAAAADQGTAPSGTPAPVQNDAPNFVAVTTKSGDANVHLRAISANGQRFFIGKDTSTYCPLSDCSRYADFTIFSARPNDANSGLGLYTNVAGGQAVFVTNEGELGYTRAHSGSSPSGSVNNPFQYTPGTDQGATGTLTFNSNTFVACPVPDQAGVYQIYAAAAPNFSKPDCIGVGVATSTYTGTPAYQYN